MSKSQVIRYKDKLSRRTVRVREKLAGSDRPRLTVNRSNKFIYAQIIDDSKHTTLAAALGKNSQEVGKKVALDVIKKGVSQVVFDRSGYKYHGRIKMLAEAAREAGLKF